MGSKSSWTFLALILLSVVATVYGRENQQDDLVSPKKVLTGGAVGAMQNGANYIIKSGGTRSYNGLNVFTTAAKTARGDPRWFARIDYATAKNPFTHLNVNKAVTGLRDPHIKISGLTARAAGVTGQALNVVQKVAPIAMAASLLYDAVEVLHEYETGDKKVAKQKAVKKMSGYVGASYGATAGAAYGTAIFPGIGTLLGGLAGAILGNMAGEVGGEMAAEIIVQ